MPSRPTSRPRANSQDSVRDVANAIRSPTKVEAPDERGTLIYLFEVTLRESGKKVYKVGKTHETMEQRERDIIRSCQHDSMVPVEELSFQHTSHATLAETIFKAEFKVQREKFKCHCGKGHTEYFDISRDVAIEALTRWREFCAKKPWSLWTNRLHSFWDNRLQDWEHKFAKAGRQDQKAIAASWRRFTEPTGWDYTWFECWNIACSFCVACFLLVLAIRGLQNLSTVSLESMVKFLVVVTGLALYCSTLHTTQLLCDNLHSWLWAELQDRSAAGASNAALEGWVENTSAIVPGPLIGSYPGAEVGSVQEAIVPRPLDVEVLFVHERRLRPVITLD